jgi:hypothetical protein
MRTPSQQISWESVTSTCDPSYAGGTVRMIMGKNVRSNLKKITKEKAIEIQVW